MLCLLWAPSIRRNDTDWRAKQHKRLQYREVCSRHNWSPDAAHAVNYCIAHVCQPQRPQFPRTIASSSRSHNQEMDKNERQHRFCHFRLSKRDSTLNNKDLLNVFSQKCSCMGSSLCCNNWRSLTDRSHPPDVAIRTLHMLAASADSTAASL